MFSIREGPFVNGYLLQLCDRTIYDGASVMFSIREGLAYWDRLYR